MAEIPQVVHSAVGPPDTWKLYQVSYSSYGADNRTMLELQDAEFEQAVSRAKAAADAVGWRVIVYRNSERSGKYLFIEPNGDAMAVIESEERVIGNVFDDLAGVIAGWREHIDASRLGGNVAVTYPKLRSRPRHAADGIVVT